MVLTPSARRIMTALALVAAGIAIVALGSVLAGLIWPWPIFLTFPDGVRQVQLGGAACQPILQEVGCLSQPGPVGTALFLGWALADLCLAIAALAIARCVLRWRQGDFFGPSVRRNLRRLAWSFLLAQVLYTFRDLLLQLYLAHTSPEPMSIMFALHGDFPLGLLFAFLLFGFIHLVSVAAFIEEEHRHTI